MISPEISERLAPIVDEARDYSVLGRGDVTQKLMQKNLSDGASLQMFREEGIKAAVTKVLQYLDNQKRD